MAQAFLRSCAYLADAIRKDPSLDVYRLILGQIDEINQCSDAAVAASIADEPPLTGSAHADALLAALAEHVAFHRNLECPNWVYGPERFLRTAWFPVDLPSAQVIGITGSPASFARRAIFIDRRDLERV